MHLNVTGHNVEVTPALRTYLEKKCERLLRHSDHLMDAHWILTVEKLRHKAEATVRLRGDTIHALADNDDMYAAIDLLADKLERMVRKHKEKSADHHAAEARRDVRTSS
jgi:putative sigma-54 modulation protein